MCPAGFFFNHVHVKGLGSMKNNETKFLRISENPLIKYLFKKEFFTWVVCFGLFMKIK